MRPKWRPGQLDLVGHGDGVRRAAAIERDGTQGGPRRRLCLVNEPRAVGRADEGRRPGGVGDNSSRARRDVGRDDRAGESVAIGVCHDPLVVHAHQEAEVRRVEPADRTATRIEDWIRQANSPQDWTASR